MGTIAEQKGKYIFELSIPRTKYVYRPFFFNATDCTGTGAVSQAGKQIFSISQIKANSLHSTLSTLVLQDFNLGYVPLWFTAATYLHYRLSVETFSFI